MYDKIIWVDNENRRRAIIFLPFCVICYIIYVRKAVQKCMIECIRQEML